MIREIFGALGVLHLGIALVLAGRANCRLMRRNGAVNKTIFTGRGQPPPSVAKSIEMKRRISDNPAAIGYLDRSSVDDSVRLVF